MLSHVPPGNQAENVLDFAPMKRFLPAGAFFCAALSVFAASEPDAFRAVSQSFRDGDAKTDVMADSAEYSFAKSGPEANWTTFNGNVAIRHKGWELRADRIRYNSATGDAQAAGHVALVGAHLGAWRAVAVAANDPAASGLALWSPWLCDLGGAETFGRPAGWLPTWQPALGFFDGVFLARRVKAPCAVVDAPLSAPDLPAAGVRLFVDALGGPKRAVWTPGGRPATKRLPGPEAVAGALEELRGFGAGNSGP